MDENIRQSVCMRCGCNSALHIMASGSLCHIAGIVPIFPRRPANLKVM